MAVLVKSAIMDVQHVGVTRAWKKDMIFLDKIEVLTRSCKEGSLTALSTVVRKCFTQIAETYIVNHKENSVHS